MDVEALAQELATVFASSLVQNPEFRIGWATLTDVSKDAWREVARAAIARGQIKTPSSSASARTLKIRARRPWDVRVEDVETGELIENVVAVEWRYTAGNAEARCQITLADVPVELIVEHPGFRWVRPE